jgi:hypothetical protein
MKQELIDGESFARLRLRHFLDLPVREQTAADPGVAGRFNRNQIVEVGPVWEFMERVWCGELHGFTEFLRPADAPDRTGSVALELDQLPIGVSRAILAKLGLALSPGMPGAAVVNQIGVTSKEWSIRGDPRNLDFIAVATDGTRYLIGCTVKEGKLSYLTMMLQDLIDPDLLE